MKTNPAIVRSQIYELLLQFPELLEDDVIRADMIEGETDLYEFLIEIERKRRDAMTMANAVCDYIGTLKKRADRFERRDEMIRKLMFNLMQAAQLKKVELPEATLSIRDGRPKTIITDEAALEDQYVRIKREPDKIKINAALSAGHIVEGATLSNTEPVLAIGTK